MYSLLKGLWMNQSFRSYLNIIVTFIVVFCIFNSVSFMVFIFNPKLFYFRPWEYFFELGYQFQEYDAFWDCEETSDLTRNNFFYYQDPHKTYVSVDKYGYRKNRIPSNKYSILVSGGSTIFGSGLSDNETLPWMLSEKLNIPIFNGGRSSLFNTLLRDDLKDVKLIIDCSTERNIDSNLFVSQSIKKKFSPIMKNDKRILKDLDQIPVSRYLITSIIFRVFHRMYNDLIVYLTNNHKQYLYINHTFNEKDLKDAVKVIMKRKRILSKMGKNYIFVAIPAKQTIYNNSIDRFTKNYIKNLTKLLNENGVETINILNSLEKNKDLGLFHPYDTHWNKYGTDIASTVIAKYLLSTKKKLMY